MGFATQFRYNWMEAIIYKSIAYIPLILIGGFQLQEVFIVHFIAIAIGHLNHANIGWDYGILKYFSIIQKCTSGIIAKNYLQNRV